MSLLEQVLKKRAVAIIVNSLPGIDWF